MRVRGLKQRRAIRLLVLGAMIMAGIVLPASASATGALSWRSPRLVDRAAPFSNPAVLNGVSCPSASLCVGVDGLGSIARTTDPEALRPTWTLTTPIEQNVTFYSISCPSVHLCVAVNQAGGSGERARIAISTDPTGSASTWKVSDANFNSIQNVVCPTTSLCVIDALGGLHVSTNPGAAHPSWKEALPESVGSDDLLSQVSCASTALCVAVGDGGGIYTSTDPAGGSSTWHRTASFPQLLFDDVSCPTTSLCVAFDENGEIVSSSDPAASGAHYVDEGQLPLMSPGVLRGLSCTPPGTCVAVDDAGDAIATTAPDGPASGWTSDAERRAERVHDRDLRRRRVLSRPRHERHRGHDSHTGGEPAGLGGLTADRWRQRAERDLLRIRHAVRRHERRWPSRELTQAGSDERRLARRSRRSRCCVLIDLVPDGPILRRDRRRRSPRDVEDTGRRRRSMEAGSADADLPG